MTALLNVPVPAAGTYTGSAYQLRVPRAGANAVMTIQETLTVTSGGTSIQVYVQTSFDGGVTWCDAIAFAALATSAARFTAAVVQAALGPAIAATDGTQTTNTVNAGVFGSWWRVKYVVVGTYVGANLRVDAFSNVGLVPAGVGA
jgi:hypothetical protein